MVGLCPVKASLLISSFSHKRVPSMVSQVRLGFEGEEFLARGGEVVVVRCPGFEPLS